MSAERDEPLRVTGKQFENVDALHRARRPAVFSALSRKQHGGALEFLDQSRRGYAQHARLPACPVQYYYAGGGKVEPFEFFLGFGDDLFAHRLSAGVVALQFFRQRLEQEVVLFQKEVHHFERAAQSARGVHARRNAEHDILRRQFLATCKQFETFPRGGVMLGETRRGDYPVVAHKRHDIGDGGKRADVEIFLVFLAEQRAHELQRHSRSAVIRKAFPVYFRVRHYAVGQPSLRLVVVGDDDIHPDAFEILHLFDRGHSAVHGDD